MDLSPNGPGPAAPPTERRFGASVWRTALGLFIVGYGAILLFENFGYQFRPIERAYVPLAVLVFGAIGLLQASTTIGRTVGAVIVVAAGAWTFASYRGDEVDFGFWWPIVLMALGVILVMRAKEATVGSTLGRGGPPQTTAIAFWSGVRRRVTSAAFSRADFVAVMGGIEADLRPAATAGGHAVIEVFVLMGGVEITVPPDWAVQNEAIVVMGGVTDRSTGGQAAAHTLVIRGTVVMGGVEIKT